MSFVAMHEEFPDIIKTGQSEICTSSVSSTAITKVTGGSLFAASNQLGKRCSLRKYVTMIGDIVLTYV